MSAASATRTTRIWPAERTAYSLRHGLGIGALGLMLGSTPAYANGIEDLPAQHRLDASELDAFRLDASGLDAPGLDASESVTHYVASDTSTLKSTMAIVEDNPYASSVEATRNGLAPELLTQMMMHANRQGMQQFRALDVHPDHVQFTGWGRDGWEMELSINLADGELFDEALRQASRSAQDSSLDRDILRQTLNFAASDGIEEIHSVEVDANAIRVQGIDHDGKPQKISLNMPWLGHPFGLAGDGSRSS